MEKKHNENRALWNWDWFVKEQSLKHGVDLKYAAFQKVLGLELIYVRTGKTLEDTYIKHHPKIILLRLRIVF